MEMLSQSGFRLYQRDAASRFYRVTRVFSICYVVIFGGVFAFSMLSFGLARASASPEALGIWQAQITDPTLSVSSLDTAVKLHQSASRTHAVSAEVDGNSRRPEERQAGEREVLNSELAVGMRSADIAWYGPIVLMVALVVLATVAFGGWLRMRAVLKRAHAKVRGAESEWQRRYADIEAREQAVRAAAAHVAVVSTDECDWLRVSMQHFMSGPLCALADLLDRLNGASLQAPQRSLVARINAAARTLSRVLEDMVLPSAGNLTPIVLEECSTDLRELVDGVVALFSPAAAQKHAYVSVSIDQSVAARVLADSARLGQIVFYLLSYAVRGNERGQIALAVWAEPINSGSQRINISVRNMVASGEDHPLCAMHVQPPSICDRNAVTDSSYNSSHISNDACLTLCRQLARHMRGELKFEIDAGVGVCGTFSAPFAIEHWSASASASTTHERSRSGPLHRPSASRPGQDLGSRPSDSFDRNYLDALTIEGLDLPTFANAWRQSLNEDLKQISSLRARHDLDALRGILHRLSGAVGLVGASDLMEALQRTSVTALAPEAAVLDVLVQRIEVLMARLDEAIHPDGSS